MTHDKTTPDDSAPDKRLEETLEATIVGDTDAVENTIAFAVPAEQLSIGRYRIDGKLGQGGMGTVYRAIDPDSDRVVAIKIMSPTLAESKTTVERFRKETRMLEEVNNPWVTNLLDSGEDNGRPFMVLEFVDGTDLHKELQRRQRIPESEAIDIIANVARALIPAHERGIIHRDIKPGNILLTPQSEDADSPEYQVRLADFGLARHIDQSESMHLTKTGALLGTPLYMSPEQCRGQSDLGPEADIYSLGVTLFALLAGRPPYMADDAIKLAAMHVMDPVPAIRQFEQSVTERTAEFVTRALAKEPADRFANAAEFLEAISQLQSGSVADAVQHPSVPVHESESIIDVELSWNLKSSRQELWPYISHTERINEALGLPAVAYSNRRNEEGQLHRFGSVRAAGMTIKWQEHPFEWVEESRFGVLREFQGGPFHWFSAMVTFEDLPDGGTLVKKRLRVLPRGLVGRLLAQFELNVKTKKAVNRVYTRIDNVLSARKRDPLEDPWAPGKQLNRTRQRRLDERATRLHAESVNPNVSQGLTQFLSVAPAQEVSRIRPLALAERLGFNADELVRTCLYAAKHELLKFQWDLICPTCRIPSDSRNVLSEIEEHASCEACDVKFAVDLGESLELSFQAHPDIREAESGTYCIGGPGHSPHVVAQLRLQPGEDLDLRIQLSAGDYLLRGPRLAYNIPLHVTDSSGALRADIPIGDTPPGGRLPLLKAGTQRLQIRNSLSAAIQIRLERTITRRDLLTARAVASLPEFRELFPLEAPAPGRLLSMSNLTIIACEFHTLPEVSLELGDVESCVRFTDLVSLIRDKVATHRGTVFRETDGTVWSSFDSEDDAIQVSAFLLELNDETFGEPSIVMHRGPVVATSRDHRLHYFGRTMQNCSRGLGQVTVGRLLAIECGETTLQGLRDAVDPDRVDGRLASEL